MAAIPDPCKLTSNCGLEETLPVEPEGCDSVQRPALTERLEAYRADLLAIASRELGADLTAKFGASDLVQETFLVAGRDAETFRGQTSEEWRGWLRAILRNLASNFRRRYRNVASRNVEREEPIGLTALDLADTITSPSRQVLRRERAEAVAQAVGRLPEHYQQVLRLHHQEGQTFEQIASRLEISPEAARKLWGRALVRLRGMLRTIE